MRSPAAYAGVTAYAHAHTGEAASAAYLALGHAYLLDHRYPDAASSFKKQTPPVRPSMTTPIFWLPRRLWRRASSPDAQALLTGFAAKYPESIFVGRLPVMIANLSLSKMIRKRLCAFFANMRRTRSQAMPTFNWRSHGPTRCREAWKKQPSSIATSFSAFLSAMKERKPRHNWPSWAQRRR